MNINIVCKCSSIIRIILILIRVLRLLIRFATSFDSRIHRQYSQCGFDLNQDKKTADSTMITMILTKFIDDNRSIESAPE